jgi:hypothetical protein
LNLYTTHELLTEMVSHYSALIHRQAGLYTCLAGLALEGRLDTFHPYAFVLTAALREPVVPSRGGWHSFAHLDPADAGGPAKFVASFKCVAIVKALEFRSRTLVADLGRDTLTIETFAPVGVMTNSIATDLATCAVSRLNHLFGGQAGAVIALNAVLMPPSFAFQQMSFEDGAVSENGYEQISGGRVH